MESGVRLVDYRDKKTSFLASKKKELGYLK